MGFLRQSAFFLNEISLQFKSIRKLSRSISNLVMCQLLDRSVFYFNIFFVDSMPRH